MLFDIDYFKKFNDTFGHQTGDFILAEMGRLIHASIRKPDIAARYGGEEFAVILSGKDGDNLMVPTERVLQAIDQHAFTYEGETHHITVSIGLTQFQYGNTGTELISRADGALYQAKNGGRNCIRQA
jgi:diguanylate cyclase (GGDEF)-like protein